MTLKEDLKAGDEITIQIAPFGEYPAETIGGVQIVEIFDRNGFEKIIDTWKNDGSKLIRADFDHASEISDSTVASGWLKDLYIDDEKGLMGTLVVSDSGATALNGLDYRFGSPTLILDDEGHPIQLVSFALTNRPRLENMDAVYNMAEPPAVQNNDETEEKSEEDKNDDIFVNNDKDNGMEKIKEILNLAEEATDEEIYEIIRKMAEKLKAIEDKEIEEAAEQAVNECGAGIDEDKKEEILNCYKQNPELVKSVLNCMKKAEPTKIVVNAQDAIKPEFSADKLAKEYAALKGGKDKVDFLKAHPGMKF